MRKRIMNQDAGSVSSPNQQWLNVEHLAQVEVSSEDAAHPVEPALIPGAGPGWRCPAWAADHSTSSARVRDFSATVLKHHHNLHTCVEPRWSRREHLIVRFMNQTLYLHRYYKEGLNPFRSIHCLPFSSSPMSGQIL